MVNEFGDRFNRIDRIKEIEIIEIDGGDRGWKIGKREGEIVGEM